MAKSLQVKLSWSLDHDKMKFWLPAKKINSHFLWKRQVFTGDSWGRQMRQNLLQSRPEVFRQNHGSLYKWNLIFHFPYRKWTHWAPGISLSRYHIIRLIIKTDRKWYVLAPKAQVRMTFDVSFVFFKSQACTNLWRARQKLRCKSPFSVNSVWYNHVYLQTKGVNQCNALYVWYGRMQQPR